MAGVGVSQACPDAGLTSIQGTLQPPEVRLHHHLHAAPGLSSFRSPPGPHGAARGMQAHLTQQGRRHGMQRLALVCVLQHCQAGGQLLCSAGLLQALLPTGGSCCLAAACSARGEGRGRGCVPGLAAAAAPVSGACRGKNNPVAGNFMHGCFERWPAAVRLGGRWQYLRPVVGHHKAHGHVRTLLVTPQPCM